MATDAKLSRNSRKRSATSLLKLDDKTKGESVENTGDLADDHDFIANYEICSNSIGLLFCLTLKRLLGLSFSTLYNRSQKKDWMDLFVRERRNLKPNVNSIEKCLMLNRLIAEMAKNHTEFARQTTQLYDELKTLMTCDTELCSNEDCLYEKIEFYRILQCQRRLFYMSPEEIKQYPNILSLQQSLSTLCARIISSLEKNTNDLCEKERTRFEKLLQHSFIIITQPSAPECVAAIKYEKIGHYYAAKVNLRILCLLDADEIDAHLELSAIATTLCSFDPQSGENGETQATLIWKRRSISDDKGIQRSFYYAELQEIKLMKSVSQGSRPFYSSKVCQLHFQLNIKTKMFDLDKDITFVSRPFGICSHAQYFPEYIAKAVIYEIEQISSAMADRLITPQTLCESICRYHTRIVGVEPKPHTKLFIFQQLQAVYDSKRTNRFCTSSTIYEDILSKLINQMECFVDHPYLSMMYHDNLFLGICDDQIDHQMNGTSEEPQILLRFNALSEHPSSQQASVRYIVHDGQLIKATFHNKAFVDEMCRMICESNSETAKSTQILSAVPNRSFHDFSLYFDDELYRLSTISPPAQETYYPLIPVLWSTMRSKQMLSKTNPPSSDVQSATLSVSVATQTKAKEPTTKPSTALKGTGTVKTDELVNYLVEKLPEICQNLQRCTSSSTEQKQRIVSDLLRDYLQPLPEVHVSSSDIFKKRSTTKSYSLFCSTSFES